MTVTERPIRPNWELIAMSSHPLALTGPLLRVIALIYPDATVGRNRPGYAMTIMSPSGEHDPDGVARLMDALDELAES